MSSKKEHGAKNQHGAKKKNSDKSGLFRLKKMVKKEFRLLKTDPINLFIALVLPPVIIGLFAFMMSFISASAPVECVVVSYDSDSFINPNNYLETNFDQYTPLFITAIENDTDSLHMAKFLNASQDAYAMEEARQMLYKGQIGVIIVLGSDFSEMLMAGMPAIISSVPDSSDIMSIQDNLNAVQEAIASFTENNNLTPQIVYTSTEEFSIPSNYNFQYNYNITLTLAFIIFGISMVLTILVVVQEKPIARLLLTPAQKEEILISKYLTYLAILAIQVTVILGVCLATGLYCAGSLVSLWIALYIVGITGVTLGIFISTLSNTKTEANQLFFAFFIIIVLLSGIFIPIDAMPLPLQIFAYILPLSHGDPMIRGIVTKGNSFIGFDFLCLLGLSVALVLITFVLMRRKRYEV